MGGFAYVLSDLYMKIFGDVRNGVFEGFFYVAMGMAFAALGVEKKGGFAAHVLGRGFARRVWNLCDNP